jgi:hypothetical protein
MKKTYLFLTLVCLMAIVIFALSTEKKVSALSEFLDDGVEYEGIIVEYDNTIQRYTIFVPSMQMVTYSYLSEFDLNEPTIGALVRVDIVNQKWLVYCSFESMYQDGYGDGFTDGGYSYGYTVGREDGYTDGYNFGYEQGYYANVDYQSAYDDGWRFCKDYYNIP